MTANRGDEELFLLEARLERQYTESERLLQTLRAQVATGAACDDKCLPEASKRAVRRLCGFWDRIVLLHQNGQLRNDFFAPEFPWRERALAFRQLVEPLDTKILQEEKQGQMHRLRSGSMECGVKRPERYRFLEEQETNTSPRWGAGTSAPIKALLAERRAALRSIDVEALQARAASLGNRGAAQQPGTPRRAASVGAGNAAAFARVSRHDAAAAQLQSQLAAEAAAVVRMRAAHRSAKEQFAEPAAAAAAAEPPTKVAGALPEPSAAAEPAKERQPLPPAEQGGQLAGTKPSLAVVREAEEAPVVEAARQLPLEASPGDKPARDNLRALDAAAEEALLAHSRVSPPASPLALPAQKPSETPTLDHNGVPMAEQTAIKPGAAHSFQPQEVPAPVESDPQTAVKGVAPKEHIASMATPVKAPELATAPSWQPSTPDQSTEALPTSTRPDWSSEEATAAKPPVKPAAAAAGETPPGPPRFSSRIPQLVQQLQSGGPDAKTSAVWALHDLAEGSPHQRIGDAVWEAEGVIPLVTMLSLADSPQAVAAAAAIGQLASADNKAFQIGVGEAGAMKSLLGMAQSDDPEAAAAATKALGSLIVRNRVLQESLHDAEGVPLLTKLLDSSTAGQDKNEDDCTEDTEPADAHNARMKLMRDSRDAHSELGKQAAAASALGSFCQGYTPGQEEVAQAGGIPKLLALLDSSSRTVKERAAEALLAVVGKHAGNQRLLREAGGIPSLLALIRGPDTTPAAAAANGSAVAGTTGGAASGGRAAEHAAALLYCLTFYQTAHAEMQAAGCMEALLPLLAGEDPRLKRHAIWAFQNLTAGAPETEEAICKAGGVPALLALIRSCSEHPDQSALTEPAVIALSNLAAGNEANKEAIMQADALPTLVKILGHQPALVAGHAARALWNLSSKHKGNQDAIRGAGAVQPLIDLLSAVPPARGVKKEAVPAQEEAAGALGSLARGNALNQEAICVAGGITRLLALMTSATPAVRGQAAWALQALTEGNAACQEALHQAGGVATLSGLLQFPEQWNWTPVVGTLKNLAQGAPATQRALLDGGSVPALVDLLTFGRPVLQAGAAEALGSLAGGSEEARAAVQEAGGEDKLRELCCAGSAAPAAVKKAARLALASSGSSRQQRSKDPRMLRMATKMLNFKLRLLGLEKISEE